MLDACNLFLWKKLLPLLLVLAAILCAVRLHGEPIRGFGSLLRRCLHNLREKEQRGIFAGALAATMGTGNLVGTALALLTGGAGALFWMWFSALAGMVLVCAENRLGAKFRRTLPDGTTCGGAVGYLRYGVKSPTLARIFALLCVSAALGMGCGVQSSTLTQAVCPIHIPAPVCGAATALLLLIVLRGGVKRVRKVSAWVVPFLCVAYLLACAVLLCMHAGALPGVFRSIFREAFGLRAAGGGFAAAGFLQAMQTGIRRGIFSNEAGLGSSALLHADAENPDEQAGIAALEVFTDTAVFCTATALVILTSGVQGIDEPTALLTTAFASGLGGYAGWFVAVCMVLLAFATMIGWYPCGLACARYLFGRGAEPVFCAAYVLCAFAGALGSPAWIWALCDLCNGCMALPNLYGILRLLPQLSPKENR